MTHETLMNYLTIVRNMQEILEHTDMKIQKQEVNKTKVIHIFLMKM